MKCHSLHLHQAPFNKISSGSKTIESRLNDEKRREFTVGDELIFISREDDRKISAKITHLHYFPDFAALYLNIPAEKFGGDSPESLLNEIREFYSEEDQQRWGVVGIEFEIN